MAHQSLYNEYRPKTFASVMGQEHVIKPLAEAVRTKAPGHAYLFAGSRGLGKTSVARILANELGCTERDLFEIDAASNNTVEGIRTLSENIYTLPFESPYKVYILDEVHMLSKSAWNAFLKTLEEPPAYAIFILATTELEKVPETVQSRCQVFEFKKPTRQILAKVCTTIAKAKGYTLAPDAADLVAILAEGSYRDALSVLQKVLSASTDKKLTRVEVEQATGAPKAEQVHALIGAIAEKDQGGALGVLKRVSQSGIDLKLYLQLVIEALRGALIIRHASDLHKELEREMGSDEFSTLKEVAEKESISHITLLAFLNANERIRFAPTPEIPLELAVLELFPDESAE